MSNELLPFAVGALIGGLARVRSGAIPRGLPRSARPAALSAALAACLGGAGVTIASGEFGAAPWLVGVDAALALAGVGAVAVVAGARGVIAAARVMAAGGRV